MKIDKEIKNAILERYSNYEKRDIELIFYKNIISPNITVYILKRKWWDHGDNVFKYMGHIDYDYDESSQGIHANTLKECKQKIISTLKHHIEYEHNEIKKFIRKI